MKPGVAFFATGLFLGFLAAISISGGPFLVFIPAVVIVCVIVAAMRSSQMLAGVLVAFGLTWVVLIGSTYARCLSMGSDCVAGGGEPVFLAVGLLVAVGGLLLSARLLYESRNKAL